MFNETFLVAITVIYTYIHNVCDSPHSLELDTISMNIHDNTLIMRIFFVLSLRHDVRISTMIYNNEVVGNPGRRKIQLQNNKPLFAL